MKRYFLIIMMMAAAVITSCTKQALDENQPQFDSASSTYMYTVSAYTEETKSDYDSDGTFKWSAGDAISVLFNNGIDNKFFTLKLTKGAGTKTATFSGEIEAGYTVGASDATVDDSKIWALFPASENHTYTKGSNPTFYVQPFVDFSETHFSANIPMYALNSEEGSFSFANLASTYKFTVNGIKDGINKVQFKIYNQTTYGLSGSWPIHADKYINYGWSSPGSETSTLTFISNVTENKAVFYVPCRYWGTFQPVITVTNYDTGVDILTFTAREAKEPNYLDHVWPITLNVSDGNYFTPAVTIDGDFADWEGVETGVASESGPIISFKATYDENYVYVYNKRTWHDELWGGGYYYFYFDTDNDQTTGITHSDVSGLECWMYLYLFGGNLSEPVFNKVPKGETHTTGSLANIICDGAIDLGNTIVETEVRIPRENVGIQNGQTVKLYTWGNKSGSNLKSEAVTLVIEN